MPTVEERLTVLERDNVEIKRRLATNEGQFEFVVGQLRDMQTYMHAKFEEIDGRFDRLEAEVAGLRRDLPGIVASSLRDVLREMGR